MPLYFSITKKGMKIMNKVEKFNKKLVKLNKVTFAIVGVIATLWLLLELILKLLGK